MFGRANRIGKFRILARLRSGGMATLYLGQRRGAAGFAKPVAIKVIHPHLARDRGFVQMFIDEANLCSRIRHPSVVQAEELGRAGGSLFLVMEYVHGCSLSQLLHALGVRERRLATELSVHIAMCVAEALHAAHEVADAEGAKLGVVHRDVSPQNILLAYEGYVKLIDFGVAKARGRVHQTTTRSLKGKLRYMAPEQAFAETVDRRADVYALGLVLWEMLTMRHVFEGDEVGLLDEVRHPNIEPPSLYSAEIPPELDRAVMKALEPKAEDRPATAQEFRELLHEAVPGASVLSPSHLARVLNVVMDEKIARDRERLPARLGQWLASAGPAAGTTLDADAVLHTSTAALPEQARGSTLVTETTDAGLSEPEARAGASRRTLGLLLGIGAASALALLAIWLLRGSPPPTPSAAQGDTLPDARVEPEIEFAAPGQETTAPTIAAPSVAAENAAPAVAVSVPDAGSPASTRQAGARHASKRRPPGQSPEATRIEGTLIVQEPNF